MPELIKPIDTILRTIREEREFRKEFSQKADNIVDKVYSYYTNPNCQCKASIVEWINAHTDDVNTLIQKYETNINALESDVKTAQEIAQKNLPPNRPPSIPGQPPNMMSNPNSRIGKIIDIPRDPTEYENLIKTAMKERWMYRGISVVPDTIDGKQVWSCFFY